MTQTDQASNTFQRVAVFGASGAIGGAFVRLLSERDDVEKVYACARSPMPFASSKVSTEVLDFSDESSLENLSAKLRKDGGLDLILVCTGMLHDDGLMPEKSLKDLNAEKFEKLFRVNTIIPALIVKHFASLLPKDRVGIFAALSARVGSISDNRLGGWYAYRASKSALNMVIKNTAIEMQRRYKNAIIVGLHPGTVDSGLSMPFQKNVKPEKLFSPDHSASCLMTTIQSLNGSDSGKCFDWAGQEVEP